MERLLRAEGFGKSFGRTEVLKSAGLWASLGRVTVLFGRNGSGKSTLLKCMLGVLRADFGVTHFAGRVDERPRLRRLARRGLFYLPDRDFLPRRLRIGTMLDAVETVCGSAGDRRRVLSLLGIEGIEGRRVWQLSGGEQRRAEWALALLGRPRCIVADEPLMGIEPRDQALVCKVLRQAAAAGCAIIVTGHEADELLDLADEVVWMIAGTTHGLGTPEQALANTAFSRGYLGRAD